MAMGRLLLILLVCAATPSLSCTAGAVAAEIFSQQIEKIYGKQRAFVAGLIAEGVVHQGLHAVEAKVTEAWRNDNHQVRTTFKSVEELYEVLGQHEDIKIRERYKCTPRNPSGGSGVVPLSPSIDTGLVGTGVDVIEVDPGLVNAPQGTVTVTDIPSGGGGGSTDNEISRSPVLRKSDGGPEGEVAQ